MSSVPDTASATLLFPQPTPRMWRGVRVLPARTSGPLPVATPEPGPEPDAPGLPPLASAILDDAQIPLDQLRARYAVGAYWAYAWLHILRPMLAALFWCGLAWYAWHEFTRWPADMLQWQQLMLHAAAVCTIVFLMLLAAPLHQRETEAEELLSALGAEDSTFPEMASYADMPVRRLALLHRSQCIVTRHDILGRMADARAQDTPLVLRQVVSA